MCIKCEKHHAGKPNGKDCERGEKIAEIYSSLRNYEKMKISWPERLDENEVNYRVEVHLRYRSSLSEVFQAISVLPLSDRDQVVIRPESSQPKSKLQRAQTKVCRVIRLPDSTLCCKVCGRKLPSTDEGELDLDQLAAEMSLRTWQCHSHECQ